ncbi:MAG TPA: hypothetical protein VGK19_18150 [Capsulimonadaceae bacterium]|jgi:hypothetical protein
MGWYGTRNASKSDIIKEQVEDRHYILHAEGNDMTLDPNKKGVCIAHKCLGSHLWMVISVQTRADVNSEFVEIDRYIELNLIRKMDGGYGYKPICESSHPYYYSCPLSYLDMVPVDKYPKSVNLEWRKVILDEDAKRKAQPKYREGDTIQFDPPIKAKQTDIDRATCLDKKRHVFYIDGYGRAKLPLSWIKSNPYAVAVTA